MVKKYELTIQKLRHRHVDVVVRTLSFCFVILTHISQFNVRRQKTFLWQKKILSNWDKSEFIFSIFHFSSFKSIASSIFQQRMFLNRSWGFASNLTTLQKPKSSYIFQRLIKIIILVHETIILGSGHYPLRSSLKKKKHKDNHSISSETSSKRTRFAMGAEQTNV